ncbi:Mth938-like domain-containing protein [Luteimonas sp. BDR2-5]|uniref:Mth938-like domain-containing protein n=1 Tax=Proluteimonas luteida TaxID=2878685 RepID=UPI001E5E436A|nr:Mth938-like domain-containing protein [Luteimonas sp. BDR2-5]MCD9027576.1 Mth938-like domain-containing protein [Luteimonas sp. BDR2-5]
MVQLVLEQPDFDYVLRGADGASALVNERVLTASFIIAPHDLVEHWPVDDVRSLAPEALAPVLALQPEVVLIGTGGAQGFPPPATMAACLSQGIGLEAMTNAAAARTFNVLAGEGRRVVAGFILASNSPR